MHYKGLFINYGCGGRISEGTCTNILGILESRLQSDKQRDIHYTYPEYFFRGGGKFSGTISLPQSCMWAQGNEKFDLSIF